MKPMLSQHNSKNKTGIGTYNKYIISAMKFLLLSTILLAYPPAVTAFSISNPGITSSSSRTILAKRNRPTTFKTSSILAASGDYTPIDGEKRVNLKVDLDSPKVATQDAVCSGDKNVYCRCWLSDTFPLCDGTHMKHNKATGDNVGPLIVSVPKKDAEQSKKKDKVAGRKNRVIVGYKTMAISLLAMVAMKSAVLVKKGLAPATIVHLVSGHVLASGVSAIMVSAAENDRLKSDTYKRLNLALLFYGLIGLPVFYLSEAPKFVVLPFLFTIINSIKGYTYGVLGWDKQNSDTSLGQDFFSGCISTVKGIVSVPKNIQSLGYLSAIIVFARKAGQQLLTLNELFQSSGAGGFVGPAMMKPLTRFGRMVFFLSILYSLKDAADRDRLGGTTFIQLNYLAALFMTTNTAMMMGASVGGYPTLIPAAYGAFFLVNGLSKFFERNTL